MSAACWRRASTTTPPSPTWRRNCDPLDADGCVPVPDAPGLGYRIDWDYIDAHRLEESC